jgi:5-methylcytosine-specific restriction endonuclease McrBC regulatory subunit McrC
VRIEVVERGRRRLAEQEALILNGAESFWQLAAAGYFSVRRTGPHVEEIVGGKYVGRAVDADNELVVVEKAHGAVRALVGAATGAELRIERAPSPETEFDIVSRHLMTEFTRAANAYVSERRVPRYVYKEAAGPTLGGSIDLPRTMRLHASGRPNHFAFSEGHVVRDEPLDRVVLAALNELDGAGRSLGLDDDTLYLSRTLAAALEEVRDEAFIATATEEHLAAADTVERDDRTGDLDRDLARLASIALMHRGFEPDRVATGTVPRAWFIDLETLFESAIRAAAGQLLPGWTVDRGEEFDRLMFTGGEDHSRVNPDVVIYGPAGAAAVGDAKYKSLRIGLGERDDPEEGSVARHRKEGRPDLYQLLAHAASLRAPAAFLAYVSDADFSMRRLGHSATGCATWVAELRPTHLKDDLATLLSAMGLVSSP